MYTPYDSKRLTNYSVIVWNRFRDINLPPQTQLFAHESIPPLLIERLSKHEPVRHTVYIPTASGHKQQTVFVPVVGDLHAIHTLPEHMHLAFSPVPSAIGERESFAYQPTEDENHRPMMERIPGTVHIIPTQQGLRVGFTPQANLTQQNWGGIDSLPLMSRVSPNTSPLQPVEGEQEFIPPETMWGYADTKQGFTPVDYLPQRVEYTPDKPINSHSPIITSPHEALHRRTIFALGSAPMLSLLAREHAQISHQLQEAGEPLPPPLTRRHVAIADGKRYPITLHLSYQEASDSHPGRLLFAVQESEGR